MLVLFKAEEVVKMQPEEYFTYFEVCIFPSDKGIGQKRAFIDSLLEGEGQGEGDRKNPRLPFINGTR